jgi:cation-transporting P-type ATPase C
MGAGGSETAMATADIALVDDHLERLVSLRQLSRQTLGIIRQNFWLALATDIVGAGLAVWGRLTPVLSGLLHVGHAGLIAVNSGRLLSWQPVSGVATPKAETGLAKV